MTVQILLTADNHLDPPAVSFGTNRSERRKDHLRCFEEAIEYAKENRPDILLLAGDIFDTVRPGNFIRAQLMNHFRNLHNLGTHIFAVSGDHDTPRSSEEGSSPLATYGKSGYVQFFESTTEWHSQKIRIDNADVQIAGISRNPLLQSGDDPLLISRVRLDGDIRVLLTHYPVEGFIGYARNDPVIRLTSIPQDCQLLGVGHFHSYQTKELQHTTIVYPGSTERTSFHEENETKGFAWLDIDRDGVISKEHIRTSARDYKTIEVDFPARDVAPIPVLEKIIDEHANSKTVVRLRLIGNILPEQLAKYRRSELLMHGEGKFFHLSIDESEFSVTWPQPITALPRTTPLEELRRYFRSTSAKCSASDRELIEEALKLCESKLEAAGAW